MKKSINKIFSVAFWVLISGSAMSQTTNDVGLTTVTSQEALLGGTVIVSGGFTGSSPTQLGRLNRDGIPSTCGGKVYPGILNAPETYHYEEFELFNNSSSPVCATIEFNPDTPAAGNGCTSNAHMAAYIGSYDPANQSLNYVGDVGSSSQLPFSFEVPANSNVVLQVSTTQSADPLVNCNFEFGYSVAELSPAGTPTGPPAVVPTLTTMGLIFFILGLLAIMFFTQRNRLAN